MQTLKSFQPCAWLECLSYESDAGSRCAHPTCEAELVPLTKCHSVAIGMWLHRIESLRWIWDENKNRINKQKHGLGFETAQLVFDDPLMAHRPDPQADEARWHTIGMSGQCGRDCGAYLAQTGTRNRR